MPTTGGAQRPRTMSSRPGRKAAPAAKPMQDSGFVSMLKRRAPTVGTALILRRIEEGLLKCRTNSPLWKRSSLGTTVDPTDEQEGASSAAAALHPLSSGWRATPVPVLQSSLRESPVSAGRLHAGSSGASRFAGHSYETIRDLAAGREGTGSEAGSSGISGDRRDRRHSPAPLNTGNSPARSFAVDPQVERVSRYRGILRTVPKTFGAQWTSRRRWSTRMEASRKAVPSESGGEYPG
jgi:hypothetical protein